MIKLIGLGKEVAEQLRHHLTDLGFKYLSLIDEEHDFYSVTIDETSRPELNIHIIIYSKKIALFVSNPPELFFINKDEFVEVKIG